MALDSTGLAIWTYDVTNQTFCNTSKGAHIIDYDEKIEGSYRTVIGNGHIMTESIDDYITLHQAIEKGEPYSEAIIHFNPHKADIEWRKSGILQSTMKRELSSAQLASVKISRH